MENSHRKTAQRNPNVTSRMLTMIKFLCSLLGKAYSSVIHSLSMVCVQNYIVNLNYGGCVRACVLYAWRVFLIPHFTVPCTIGRRAS